jgi:hypothetical protein
MFFVGYLLDKVQRLPSDIPLMNKRAIVPYLVKGLPIVVLGALIIRHQQFKSDFARITTGASQAEVIKLLGEPFDVVACAAFDGKPPEGCTKEFSYVSIPTFSDVWEISFDANDRVIRKQRYRSP